MSKAIRKQGILIIDFGSQYTQLIARRVRECGVYCELMPFDIEPEEIRKFAPHGIILAGGPETVTCGLAPRAPEIVFTLGCPVLGVCYGMQTMVTQLGGEVEPKNNREYGYAQARLEEESLLLTGIEDQSDEDGTALIDVWMSHSDKITVIPPGFKLIASTSNAPLAGIADEVRKFYGLLFHPEVTHTRQGKRIISRFAHDICGCENLWTPENIIKTAIMEIRKEVGKDQVILGLSGGVDSSVVAALLHKAIGEQLICVFVDTGLLRANEADQVMATFGKHMGLNIIKVDAKSQFLEGLQGMSDPEEKRKTIGKLFVDIFEYQAKQLPQAKWLAQGTIYPDVIESAANKYKGSAVIKSHHNVGGLPDTMQLKLLEPLRDLFKDEVRQLGLELGLPYDMVYRHPFPGPGLAVRILGEVKEAYVEILQKADDIFIKALHEHDLYQGVSQAFAVFLPIKSVGVLGDARHYDYVIALRAVETTDFMTAHWAHLPYEFLAQVSQKITNEVAGVSRVVYDISGKPPATIEWE